MPLLAATTQAPPVDPQPPLQPLPPSVPPAAPFVTWTQPGGVEMILSDGMASGIMLGGVDDPGAVLGADMPPEDQAEVQFAASDGGMLVHRRASTREMTLPVVIHADTLAELENYRRELFAAFNPRRGDGVLRWQLPDGKGRDLTCRYSGGMESSESGRVGSLYFQAYALVLRARDPYWYGDEVVQGWMAPAAQNFYGGGQIGVSKATPYVISNSDTFGEVTITIDGEVEVYPVWEIGGPCTTATLAHPSEGTLQLTPNLSAGQTLTVRTDPRVVAARKFTRDGTNVWGQVAGDFPVLWPLQPGTQTITVMAAGTVDGQSRIQLRYRPRYLSA